MRVSAITDKIKRITSDITTYGFLYSNRMDDGRRILQMRKMLRRRIATLKEWLDVLEAQLNEDEYGTEEPL